MPPGTLPAEYVLIGSVMAVLSDVYLNTDRIFYHKTIVLWAVQKNFIQALNRSKKNCQYSLFTPGDMPNKRWEEHIFPAGRGSEQ